MPDFSAFLNYQVGADTSHPSKSLWYFSVKSGNAIKARRSPAPSEGL
jgi:hypothetical protein